MARPASRQKKTGGSEADRSSPHVNGVSAGGEKCLPALKLSPAYHYIILNTHWPVFAVLSGHRLRVQAKKPYTRSALGPSLVSDAPALASPYSQPMPISDLPSLHRSNGTKWLPMGLHWLWWPVAQEQIQKKWLYALGIR